MIRVELMVKRQQRLGGEALPYIRCPTRFAVNRRFAFLRMTVVIRRAVAVVITEA